MLLLLLCTPRIIFAIAPSQEEFNKAIVEFKAGRFDSASKAFERAREQGIDTPALNYNLGVTYYKLKKYELARQAFQRTARGNGWEALSYYNIGLIAYRQQDNEAARKYARMVLHGFADEKLYLLARRLLLKASPTGSADYWVARFDAGLGYDSNVALTNNQSVLLSENDRDTFIDVALRASHSSLGNDSNSMHIYGGLFRTDYTKENAFDLSGIETGLDKQLGLGSWNLGLGGNWQYLDLDGSAFYSTGELVVTGTTGDQSHKGLNLTYRLKRFSEGSSDYKYLRGWQTAVAIASAYKTGEIRSRYGFEYQVDRREDLQVNGEEYSFSPSTGILFGNLKYMITGGWEVAGNLQLGSANYNTDDVRTGQAPVTRKDSYYEISLKLMRAISHSWRASAELSTLDNRSNIDEFDFKRNLFLVSGSYRF